MQEWEYLHIYGQYLNSAPGMMNVTINGADSKQILSVPASIILNERGKQGWGLVSLIKDGNTWDAIFKRPK
jgi:hypothetical protein